MPPHGGKLRLQNALTFKFNFLTNVKNYFYTWICGSLFFAKFAAFSVL